MINLSSILAFLAFVPTINSDLIVKLLYACDLRLSACDYLRIKNFNFDAGVLTIHDEKGKRDRTLPIPEVLVSELKAHMEKVAHLHKIDLADNYNGAFMFNVIEKNINMRQGIYLAMVFPCKSPLDLWRT